MLFFLNALGLQDSNIDGPKREVDSSMLRVRQTALYLQQKCFNRHRQMRAIRKKLERLDYTRGSVIAVEGINLLQYCFLMKSFE